MTSRPVQPSAMSAETAERMYDRDPTAFRRVSKDELQASVYQLRGEIDQRDRELAEWRKAGKVIKDALAILKADNEDAAK